MKHIGIFYGSSTGTTAAIALRIAHLLDVDKNDIHNVADSSPSDIADYDTLILGSSTWRDGDLQVDWIDFLKGLEILDLQGKKIALFGCGDETMTKTFCDAVGIIYEHLRKTGAEFIAPYDTVGYDFEKTAANIDGVTVGLLLDEVNHPEATDIRLRGWVNEIKDTISR